MPGRPLIWSGVLLIKPCLSWNYFRSLLLSNPKACLQVSLLLTDNSSAFSSSYRVFFILKDQEGQISYSSPKFLRHTSLHWLKALDLPMSLAANCFSAVALVLLMWQNLPRPRYHFDIWIFVCLPPFKWFTAFLEGTFWSKAQSPKYRLQAAIS